MKKEQPECGFVEGKAHEPDSLTADNHVVVGQGSGKNMFGKLIEWFWRGSAIKGARVNGSPTHRRFCQLAIDAGQLGKQSRDALFDKPTSDILGCELYRQSIYWSLLAAITSDSNVCPAAASHHDPSGSDAMPDMASVWERVDQERLKGACDAETLQWFGLRMLDASFAQFAGYAPAELEVFADRLESLSRSLITLIERPSATLRKLVQQRVIRLGMLVAIPLLVWAAVALQRQLNPYARDLARGKPWRASSNLIPVCVSPLQTCNDKVGFFFHTLEENRPWFEIDLGSMQKFAAVRVLNRTDCCRERAVPLYIEVSNNGAIWTRVAQQDSNFTYWYADFPPVTSRFVRLISPRFTYLHLREVLVLP